MIELPLREMDYNLSLSEQDLSLRQSFPPPRYYGRNQRLELYDDLWVGELRQFVDDTNRTKLGLPSKVAMPSNVFRRSVTSIVDLLLMSTPESSVEFDSLIDICGNGLTDLMRYGGVDFWAGETPGGGPFVSRIRPHRAYRVEDGGHLLLYPFISSEQGVSAYDRIEIVRIYPDFMTTSTVYSYQGSQIGQQVEEEVVIAVSSIFEGWRTPYGDGWGTSMFDDMIRPGLEISKRYSSNSMYLDILGNPFLWLSADDQDLEEKYKDEIGEFAGIDPDDYGMASDTQKQAGVLRGLSRTLEYPVVDYPNTAVNAEFVSPSSKLTDSFRSIEEAQKDIDQHTGIIYLRDPGVLSSTSGVGLDRVLLPLYARTSRTQNELVQTLEAALSFAANQEVTITWPHVVDMMREMNPEQQQAQLEQMVGVANA